MKLTHLFSGIIIALVLAGSLQAQTIQTGTFKATEKTPNYSLSTGTGDRLVGITVKFDKAFATVPQIVLGVTTVDCDKVANLRYEVKADAVTRDGFTLQIKTWSDTKIFTIGGTWLAVDTSAPAVEKAAPKAKKGKK